jgi:hypothetical protein
MIASVSFSAAEWFGPRSVVCGGYSAAMALSTTGTPERWSRPHPVLQSATVTPVGSLGSEATKWADFYLVAGSSAAVLIGLLFVALSIHGPAVADDPYRGGQARQAIYALASIIVVSFLVLIPDQSAGALGAELIVGALLNLLLAVWRQARRLHAIPATARRASVVGVAIYDGAMLLIVAGGVVLATGLSSGLYVLAPGVIALLLLAIANSWVLTLVRSEQAGEV